MAKRPPMDPIAKDFPSKTRGMLRKKGIVIVGSINLPNAQTGSYANGERGYMLDDNGTSKIRTYMDVLKIAAEPTPPKTAKPRNAAVELLEKRFPLGARVTSAASRQIMTKDQALRLYGHVEGYNLIGPTVLVKCDDGMVRQHPAEHLSRVLRDGDRIV